VYMPSPSIYLSTGFYVELSSTRCEFDGDDRLIVLHITDTGELFLNLEQEDWNNLENRLSQIYGMREHRTLYLVADSDVPFRTIAEALDTIENASATQTGPQVVGMSKDELDIRVQLLTPKAFNDCPLKPVVTGSRHSFGSESHKSRLTQR
jgi:hypothetical protein